MSSQEQALNLTGTGADYHHKELKARGNVSPDHIRTVDLDKDNIPGFSVDKSPADKGLVPAKVVLGFSGDSSSVKQRISGEFLDGTRAPACGALVDNVAERFGHSALRKNFGFLKKISEETINLQSGGVGGDIPAGTESVDTGFKETAIKGVSPMKAADKEPEFSVCRGKEVRSSPEKGTRGHHEGRGKFMPRSWTVSKMSTFSGSAVAFVSPESSIMVNFLGRGSCFVYERKRTIISILLHRTNFTLGFLILHLILIGKSKLIELFSSHQAWNDANILVKLN
ncbi:hypothetical protein NE237_013262 [Protea cynaroides]|uniref:Uncharacterized protein n=1 Tax=Protea cynaroides TaxID=273540 RepID=A0A9Q0JXP3_9MAGN|nr:hypothetical protein NE237_013262 [Protea cynaroides]